VPVIKVRRAVPRLALSALADEEEGVRVWWARKVFDSRWGRSIKSAGLPLLFGLLVLRVLGAERDRGRSSAWRASFEVERAAWRRIRDAR
jgi:hypothetical protein